MSDYPMYVTPDGEELYEYEFKERFNEMLDAVYGTISVAGLEFDASRVVEELDPIAHRTVMLDYADSLMREEELDEWSEDHEWLASDEDWDEDEDLES